MRGWIVLFLLICIPCSLMAQASGSDVAVWYLPGVSWQATKKVRLQGQLGYNHYYSAGLGYAQGFITVHKNIVLNPAYIYYGVKRKREDYRGEHFLMNAVIGQVSIRRFFLDDRNMLWNRIGRDMEPLHYYRNRLRAAWQFQPSNAGARLYAYNEAYYHFNNSQWSRNRFAGGISYDVIKHANIDITYIRQWDRSGGWINIFFVQTIWKI